MTPSCVHRQGRVVLGRRPQRQALAAYGDNPEPAAAVGSPSMHHHRGRLSAEIVRPLRWRAPGVPRPTTTGLCAPSFVPKAPMRNDATLRPPPCPQGSSRRARNSPFGARRYITPLPPSAGRAGPGGPGDPAPRPALPSPWREYWLRGHAAKPESACCLRPRKGQIRGRKGRKPGRADVCQAERSV